MSVGNTVGFSPVPGPGAALTGAPGNGASAPAGPLGLFQALLAVLAPEAGLPVALSEDRSTAPDERPQLSLITNPASAPAAAPHPAANEDGEVAPVEALLADVIEQLGLLQDALDRGEVPAAGLERKLGETLAALTQALGIPSDARPGGAAVAPTETNWLAIASALSAAARPAGQAPSPQGPVSERPITQPLRRQSTATTATTAATAAALAALPGIVPEGVEAIDGAPPPRRANPLSGTAPNAGASAAPLPTAPPAMPSAMPSATSSATPGPRPQAGDPAATSTDTVSPGRAPESAPMQARPVVPQVPTSGPPPQIAISEAPNAPMAGAQDRPVAPPADRPLPDPAPRGAAPADALSTAAAAKATSADPDVPTAPQTRAHLAERPSPDGGSHVIARLAERIAKLAETVKPASPELAQKLEALANRLHDGTLDRGTVQKLGAAQAGGSGNGDLAEAIERLLSERLPTRPLPSGEMLGAPRLALPKLGAVNAGGENTPAARSLVQQGMDLQATPTARPGVEAQPVSPDRPAPQPAARSDSAPAPLPGGGGMAAPDAGNAAPPSAPPHAPGAPVEGRAIAAAYRMPQINVPQLAVEIVKHVQAGRSSFQIRLDPPELGRIDVKLEMDAGGKTVARMTVERAETLDLMQRDQRALERALSQAGLDSHKTSLEFSLRQNPFGRDGSQHQQHGPWRDDAPAARAPDRDETQTSPPPMQITAYRGFATASGVNLFV